ncbi:MAG: hypothetical protein LBL94_01945 [Prevotellaceae bacterium]|jgi:hypothetical protein|nr:hypothetical protein [Prevotellaceae bacterium]
MKSNSDVRPPVLQDLGDGSWRYSHSIKEVKRKTEGPESGEEKTVFEYETVHIWGKPTYEALVPLVIAELYSPSKETSLINKYNAYVLALSANPQDKDDYEAYLAHTFEIKAMVKNDLQNFNTETP